MNILSWSILYRPALVLGAIFASHAPARSIADKWAAAAECEKIQDDSIEFVSHSGTACYDRITRNFSPARFDHRGRAAGITTVGTAAVIGTLAQAAKASQKVVQVSGRTKGEQSCCALFEAPSSCKSVDGTIAPQRRILWAASDIVENRPALSRWHLDYAGAFAAFVKGG